VLLPSAEAGPRSSGVMFFESGYSDDLMTQTVLLTTLSKNTPPPAVDGTNTYRLSVIANAQQTRQLVYSLTVLLLAPNLFIK
jgi:hypothetical protein